MHTLKWLFPLGALSTNWGWLTVATQDRGSLFPVRLPSGSTPPPMIKYQPLIRLVFFYLLLRACAGSCRFFRTSIFCIPSRFAHNSLSPRHYSLVPLPIIQVEVRMLVFLFLVNSIDYMRTNQCGLIGELLGEGNTVL